MYVIFHTNLDHYQKCIWPDISISQVPQIGAKISPVGYHNELPVVAIRYSQKEYHNKEITVAVELHYGKNKGILDESLQSVINRDKLRAI